MFEIRVKWHQKPKTDYEACDLKGTVYQLMQVTYKAQVREGEIYMGKVESDSAIHEKNFIITFNKHENIIEEQLFGTEGIETKTYNDKKENTSTLKFDYDGNLTEKTTITYNDKGGLVEYLSERKNTGFFHRQVQLYDEAGRQHETFTYMKKPGDEKESLREHNITTYHANGKQLSRIQQDANGKIKYQASWKYDKQDNEVEHISEWMEGTMIQQSTRTTKKYNEHNDVVEHIVYKLDGTIKNAYTYQPQYDINGKKIIPPHEPYDPNPKAPGESEEVLTDKQGNWIKKTIFYNKIPVKIITRDIIYFGKGKDKKLIHPLTIKETKKADKRIDAEPLSKEDARWLAEGATSSENFSALRYYTLQFDEHPSVISYTGPAIEAIQLLENLKENLGAQVIHSYSTSWNQNSPVLSTYTLAFQYQRYILKALGLSRHNSDEYEIPSTFKKNYEGYVYTSQFQLLMPSDASGNRDEDFEFYLNRNIEKCLLRKKPDKPVINMIEVSGNSYTMTERPVSDDFVIKDLDVNYGYGFSKFHDDLMKRFSTSSKGLVLFHGQPGTGKTFYIRHLLRKMASNKKVVIYMPPNMVDHLVEPLFMTFLASEIKAWSSQGNFCVLLIEDAEPLLAKRQEGVRIQGVTNLLNMTDGLLNDMLNMQIICTFNVDLRKLDSALLRPGRLIARKEFKALGELDANLLAQRLGIKHHFDAPATLGEIYAMLQNQNTLIHDVEHDKDSSTLIDEIL